MAAFLHFLKTIFLPLLTACILYLLLAHLLLPFIRRHRTRYSHYLPLPLTQDPSTPSWRTRISDALYNLFVPSSWTRRRRIVENHDDEEGEGLVGFEPVDGGRRNANSYQEERRLGRELEEGFRDESSGSEEEGEREICGRRSMSTSRSSALD